MMYRKFQDNQSFIPEKKIFNFFLPYMYMGMVATLVM